MSQLLFFAHYALLSFFGVALSFSFTGLRLHGRNAVGAVCVAVGCCLLQLVVYLFLGEWVVWRVYPLITHVPLAVTLCLFYKKPVMTSVAAVATAYLCCQPAKWIGLLVLELTGSTAIEQAVRIGILLLVGFVCIWLLAPHLAGVFNKDTRSVLIFGSIPMVYYLFDYISGIYMDLWTVHTQLTGQFLSFFLCVVFMLFCTVYYRQYEQKAEAQQREKMVSLQVQQQAERMEKARESEQLVRLLRHDMRHHLSSLAVCLEGGEYDKALELIREYLDYADVVQIKRFCENDMINYVLTDFSAKCQEQQVELYCTVELTSVSTDEIMLCSILSNALENALLHLSGQRYIRVMLKTVDGRLLISVKNPIEEPPQFVDGLPAAKQEGHGYGTRSIRYITEKLGGNCQFSAGDGVFVVRVVI